ncbi:MAG: SUMF1/EgtB/PvdO family nonheme iron enzyme [Anaerolineae bacterium]|nr:SUMF1/EgtB/PvdO family nonheme iron enzyme [Anaerolineae bacterium]
MTQLSGTILPTPFAWVEISGKGYHIAKYPITNAQFAKFIEAGSYDQRRWWTDAGWDARQQGLALDWSTGKAVPGASWRQPRFWDDPQWNGADYPVVGVSWYEAVAFCRWLSDATGESITLPTEDQWQYAAQGDDGRTYPWGNEWDCTRCNNSIKPCHSDATTPVRQYEGVGDSPFGVVDMSGNVWEWCLTTYEDKTNDLDGDAGRVIRGGGWFYFTTADCRCNFRYWDMPFGWYNFRGFRIARA